MAVKDPLLSRTSYDNVFSLASAKARKSVASARGGGTFHVNAMLYMAPWKFAGFGNVCTSALHCVNDCLWRSGQTLMKYQAQAKFDRTKQLYDRLGGDRKSLVEALTASGSRTPDADADIFIHRIKSGWKAGMTIEDARREKTRRWFQDREAFLEEIYYSIKSIDKAIPRWRTTPTKYLTEAGYVTGAPLRFVVRLNGTQDLAWERVLFKGKTFFDHFPHLQFYDYTKHVARALAFARGEMPRNYHLTFSMGGIGDDRIPEILKAGCNVTMVFDKVPGLKKDETAVPKWMSGPMTVTGVGGKKSVIEFPRTPVLFGDEDDLRYLDPPGQIVGLKYKATTGQKDPAFVIRLEGDVERWLKHEVSEPVGAVARENPGRSPSYFVDVVDTRTGRVLESRVRRTDAQNTVWFARRFDNNKHLKLRANREDRSRRNPDEADLLGGGPTGAFVPGSIPAAEIPFWVSGGRTLPTDRVMVYRVGCGGMGSGKPLEWRP